jgi:hypothetical protein
LRCLCCLAQVYVPAAAALAAIAATLHHGLSSLARQRVSLQ